ncbi:hypothetical protein D9757_003784 [Collybiopsis confluens]|uniref:Uncharacterized protein n=1 Tax=Collybiopsis confluens TaxID=2823264 RepID=A0A8H5HV99_9AGAR|nr:hypothetical protein D9757_003784 [Collybiopsis confluens]
MASWLAKIASFFTTTMSHLHPPLKLATLDLGLSPETAPYIDELSSHLANYPNYTNFKLFPSPLKDVRRVNASARPPFDEKKFADGKITCLEQGCMADIHLQPNSSVPDSGKELGIGSLSAYYDHIAQHPYLLIIVAEPLGLAKFSHVSRLRNRLEREHWESIVPAAVKQEFSTPSIQQESSSYGQAIAPTPSSSLPFHKRAASPDISSSTDARCYPAMPTAKRLKVEVKPRSPLATSTNTMGPLSAAQDEGDVRSRIEELQGQMSHKQAMLDKACRKKPKNRTAADRTRITRLAAELSALRAQKAALNSSRRLMSPVKGTSFLPKAESIDPSDPPQAAASSLVFAQPALPVVPVKAERYPAHIFSPPSAAAGPSHYNHAMNADGDTMVDYQSTETTQANAIVARYAGTYIPHVAPMKDSYDEDGTFHGRGRDHFEGPTDKFLIEAGNAETFDHNATVDEALKKLGLSSLYALLPGMEVALMAHQAIGVAWLVEKERSFFRGGLLADEMGLGKTVQIIAMMMVNRPKDAKCKTTLILAPTSLLGQWQQELELKTNADLKCLIYHGSNKPKRTIDLLKYDVVLTTYGTMALEWVDVEGEEKKKKRKAKAKATRDDFLESDSEGEFYKTKKKKRTENGLLFQVQFGRIVLDEAQFIRNKMTRASRAVTALNATHRWCLTGTPIINGLLESPLTQSTEDAYGMIRFLRIRPWYDWDQFHPHVSRLEKKNPQLAITRIQAILSSFMLRRKKDSKLDGKILIELPPKEITLQRLGFSEEEREIYNAVEKSMQMEFNRFLRAGTVLKNYSTVLVLLLRLRQCCVHPSLIQEDGVAFVQADEIDDAGKVLKRARDLVSDEYVRKLKTKFLEHSLARMKAESESQYATVETEECPICYDNFSDACITSCGHSFCKNCIMDVLKMPLAEAAQDEPNQYKANERPCPSCRAAISKDLLFEQAAFMPTDEDLKGTNGTYESDDSDIEMVDIKPSTGKARAKRASSKPKKAKRPLLIPSDNEGMIDIDVIETEPESNPDYDDDEDEEEKDARKGLKKRLGKRKAVIILDSDEEEQTNEKEKDVLFGKNKMKNLSPAAIKLLPKFLPSTKMKWMMAHVIKLFEERPDEKILVLSQWTSCLSLVSDYLKEHNVLHVKYQGDMNRAMRDKSVRSFMSKDLKVRVMLMSLKCGGVGLNLVRGNNVISLDLAWSQAIESQAYDRVHRLGQTLPVHVKRLVIENTVEERILAMQERKQSLADGSLGEGNARKISKMTVKQLAELFGLDGNGRLLPRTAIRKATKADDNTDSPQAN